MRTYTITKYDREDYDEYENGITIEDVIESLKYKGTAHMGLFLFYFGLISKISIFQIIVKNVIHF
jgi:hypothetical protein